MIEMRSDEIQIKDGIQIKTNHESYGKSNREKNNREEGYLQSEHEKSIDQWIGK